MIPARRLTISLATRLKNEIRRNLNFGSASVGNMEEVIKKPEADEKTIIVSQDGQVTLIGINRPSKKNCINNSTSQLLCEALESFESNENSMVAIIHGIGGSFSSGFDLNEIAQLNSKSDEEFPHFGALSNIENQIKKPLIASISGYAVDVGLELALMCDLRVVEETSSMGFLNRRMGIPTMCGGTVRLPAIIGYSRAMEMILTGRTITAQEAFNWGLANLLVPCGAALGQSLVMAQSITKFPQKSLLANRQSAHNATFSSKQIDEALQYERDISSHLLIDEGLEGAQKFLQGFGRHGKSTNIKKKDYTTFKELSDDLL